MAFARAADISDYDAVRALAADLTSDHGSMDVVMNIAGVSAWGTVRSLEHRDWRRLVDVNLMGPIHVIEELVPPMIEARRGGHLVNVSSAAGHHRDALARGVHRLEVRPARRLRGAALRPAPAPDRGQPGVPGRRAPRR